SWSRERSHQRKPTGSEQEAWRRRLAIFCARGAGSNRGDIEIITRDCAGKRDRCADNRYGSVLRRIGCDAVGHAICACFKWSAPCLLWLHSTLPLWLAP